MVPFRFGFNLSFRFGLSLIEMLLIAFVLSTALLPIFHHLVSTAAYVREIALIQAAGAINSSFMEVYRSQPYRRLKLIEGEQETSVPSEYRGRLATRLHIKELIPDRLIGITLSTSFLDTSKPPQSLSTLVSNHHPVVGTRK